MAHFAKVVNGIVEQVIVADQEFIDKLEDKDLWIQTSYNTHGGVHLFGGTPLRKNYANGGYTYDKDRDAFIPPQPYPSWILDENTCLWSPPVEKPEQEIPWFWNEVMKKWYMYPFEHNKEVFEERISVCEGCPFFIQSTAVCTKCNCVTTNLHTNEDASCPEGKW